MKNILIILFATALFFSSCKKSSSSTADVRYEFTSTTTSQYKVDYAITNDLSQSETFNGTTWSKSVTMKVKSGPDNFSVARLTVYPPANWVGSSNSASVVLKIFVNNEERTNKTDVMNSANATAGVDAIVTF